MSASLTSSALHVVLMCFIFLPLTSQDCDGVNGHRTA